MFTTWLRRLQENMTQNTSSTIQSPCTIGVDLSQRIEGPIWLEKDEILLLKAKISDAQKKRRKDELAKLKNVLSPIRRAPLDILSQIFVLCCCDDSFGNRPKDILETTIRYTPLVLASVCIAWKIAAHDTPGIWSVLYLRLGDTRDKDQVWVQRWLSRSRSLPLELHLQYHGGSIYFPLERAREIMDTILGFHRQIRILDFWGRPEAIVALFPLPSSSLPLLERLSLALESHITTEPIEWKIAHGTSSDKMKFLLGSPALRDVKIVECKDISITSESLIPYNQLTSLKVDYANHHLEKPDLIVDLLQRCGNIAVLELHVPLGLEFDPATPIVLPLLRSLTIKSGGDNMGPLCHISAPSLEDLSLSWPHDLNSNLHRLCDEVIDFQRRSSSTLLSLTIREIKRLDKEVVIMLLSALPSIKLLRTVNIIYRMRLFQCLTLPGVESMSENDDHGVPMILLPHLTHLEVLGFYSSRFSAWERELLCNMIRSRLWTESDESNHSGLTCLQKVTFDQGSKLYGEQRATIAGLAGLEVAVLPIFNNFPK
ncbi:hypothetical protein BDP27DRAFT_1364749 [Rhodocollybia butyracea]|uniref:F-box domain-containing protein n=1 Tax=Rhodocollybia butyracea TaxID=206335 RepID=A0A9P5U7B0_9AGAR|nr:hypothetical protein BDP27DRAFT_1364749 [Rhodocollybia butyracea]